MFSIQKKTIFSCIYLLILKTKTKYKKMGKGCWITSLVKEEGVGRRLE
jgi:hypothetical protein